MSPDRHGSTARCRSGERARGARGGRDSLRRRATGFHRARPRCVCTPPRAVGSRRRCRRRPRARSERDDGRICARGVRALDSRAGWRPGPCRASTCPDRPRGRCIARRRHCAARRIGSRQRRARARGRKADEGGRDRSCGRRRLCEEARRHRLRGSRARQRCTHATTARHLSRSRPSGRRTRSGTNSPWSAEFCSTSSSSRMPELPEVETIRAQLAPRLEGKAPRSCRDPRPEADAAL